MKASGPCCTTLAGDRITSWEEVRGLAAQVPPQPQEPPQLMEGMTGLIDLGGTPTEIGRVFTYVQASSATWTEHWVVQPAGWFSDPDRNSRLAFPRPQPPTKPWSQLEPNFVGWYHAAIVYQYQPPPTGTPQLPVNTFAFNVHATGATPTYQGRLFRTATTAGITDRWVLFPGYIQPNHRTETELHPVTGNIQALFADALADGGPTAEYVDVSYTVALL